RFSRDWSSDVCSSDLLHPRLAAQILPERQHADDEQKRWQEDCDQAEHCRPPTADDRAEIGRKREERARNGLGCSVTCKELVVGQDRKSTRLNSSHVKI